MTIGAISLFRLLVLVGSQFITNRISTGNETENNLSAEINEADNNGEIAFDYPYGTVYTMVDSTEMDAYKDHYDISTERIQEIVKTDVNPPKDLIQYQEAVNICGEAIKYIYGYTAQSNNKSLILYQPADNNYEFGMNFVYYFDGTADFSVQIDPQTGKILYFRSNEHINIKTNPDEKKEMINEIPSDQATAKIMETILKDLEILGYKESMDTIAFHNIAITARSNYDWYNVTVVLSNGMRGQLGYSTTDEDYFELGRFYLN